MDEESESVKKVREMIQNSLGLNPKEQNDIETSVVEAIQDTETIFEGMSALRDQDGMDPKSIFAGTMLGSLTTPAKTKVCVAVPVDLIDQMLGMFDPDDEDETDDSQLSEQEIAEIAEILRKGETKVAD